MAAVLAWLLNVCFLTTQEVPKHLTWQFLRTSDFLVPGNEPAYESVKPVSWWLTLPGKLYGPSDASSVSRNRSILSASGSLIHHAINYQLLFLDQFLGDNAGTYKTPVVSRKHVEAVTLVSSGKRVERKSKRCDRVVNLPAKVMSEGNKFMLSYMHGLKQMIGIFLRLDGVDSCGSLEIGMCANKKKNVSHPRLALDGSTQSVLL